MARGAKMIALCALLSFARTAIANPSGPDSTPRNGSTSTSQAETYKAANDTNAAAADLEHVKRIAAEDRLADQKALTAAVTELALERKAHIEAASLPGWVWPTIALAICGVFAGGFALGYSADHK